tara:strand:- start:245 stop:673 length:429 start_codon:yes stop_codon:yes gene_type:complete
MQIQPPTTIEEAIKLLLHYVGITKLTKKNVKKVYLRSKQLQAIMQGGGFWEGRMPYLRELEEHLDFESEAPKTHDDKKWGLVLVKEITNIAKQWQGQEEAHLSKEEEPSQTINEENEEAKKELEKLTEESGSPKEEPKKYLH